MSSAAWLSWCLLLGQSAPDMAPSATDLIRPEDLPRLAKAVPEAWAPLFEDFSRPFDRIVTDDGLSLEILPSPRYLQGDPEERVDLVLRKKKEKFPLALREIKKADYWEESALQKVAEIKMAGKTDLPALRAEEWLLRFVLQWHESQRQRPLNKPNPWLPLEQRLRAGLAAARAALLEQLPDGGDEPAWRAARDTSRAWHAADPKNAKLQTAATDLHLRFARDRLAKEDGLSARKALEWIDEHVPAPPGAKELRDELRQRARTLVKEALAQPDAVPKLREALDLWPQVSQARDELARRAKTFRVVYVAVPYLPLRLSPAAAASSIEKQALYLIFSRLTTLSWSKQGKDAMRLDRGDLARTLPWPRGRTLPIDLPAERYWSDGMPVTSADVRHTYELHQALLGPRQPLLRELLEKPRLPETPRSLELKLRQDLFDPLALTRVYVLPVQVRDPKDKGWKPLDDPTAAEFAQNPTGSGPFFYHGTIREDGIEQAVFRANPGYPRSGKGDYIGEVRFFVWPGPEAKKAPTPHLVLEPAAAEAAHFSKAGYRAPSMVPSPALHTLLLNHRRPDLAQLEVRLALAHGVHRANILKDWNTAIKGKDFIAQPATGPFARDTWMHPPADVLKADPFAKGADRVHARAAAKNIKELKLTFLYPEKDERIKKAATAMQTAWQEAFSEAGVACAIAMKEMPVHALHDAVNKRDFDIAWQRLDHPEDVGELWSLLDDHDAALLPPLGGNVLGYRNDPELIGLLRKALAQQPFPAVRDAYQKIHLHLFQTMPFIPLWHEEPPLLVHPSLDPGLLDARRVFANVPAWTVRP